MLAELRLDVLAEAPIERCERVVVAPPRLRQREEECDHVFVLAHGLLLFVSPGGDLAPQGSEDRAGRRKESRRGPLGWGLAVRRRNASA